MDYGEAATVVYGSRVCRAPSLQSTSEEIWMDKDKILQMI